ncbi:PREDICTED: coiled-coil domain-containing protein 42A, partial [Nestor notabilis]|uniref:coiled-coil domain-containing protein 42A n=1 Tax=Nestor notabilis TaxID=176057 RepID=UPI0005236D06
MATMEDEDLLDYFHIEYGQNILHLQRKPRQAEEDSLSLLTHLQEKKKESKLMQKALEAKKEEFKERMKALVCGWRDLHAQEAEVKTHMEKSLRIVKEDDKMRDQTLKKATKEREKKIQKEFELLRAKRELEVWRNKHEKLYSKVQKYSIFKKYLEDVVKISQFEDIQEVVSRYKTLLSVYKDLEQLQQRHKEMSEQARVFLDQYTEEKEAEILHYINELVELQQCFDQAKEDVQFWETCWAGIQKTSTKKTLELGIIRMATLNLFQCAKKQMKAKQNVPVNDSLGQLNMIQQVILADISMEGKEDMQDHQRAAVPTGHAN